ncbi:FecCD family ABC transporter permease [Nesterenkonia populi]
MSITARRTSTEAPAAVSPARAPLSAGGRRPGSAAPASRGARLRRRTLTTAVLLLVLVVTVLLSAQWGQFTTSTGEVLGSLHRAITGSWSEEHRLVDATLWQVRFPRIVLCCIVGACLGIGGALMQGVFGNPLAEPGVIGVTSGAAVGACAAIVFGAGAGLVVPAAAFLGGLVVAALVYSLSRSGQRSLVLTLVLTGIAINAVAGAMISFLIFLADTTSRETIIFWQMGSLNGSTWQAVLLTGMVGGTGILLALTTPHKLDVLSLGESTARHTGVNVERLRLMVIVLVALISAAAVSFAGLIGFIGLVVPHALRLVLGPSHAALLPLSALGGAALLSIADVVARSIIPYADLPIGIFTALVGGPVFFILLRTTLKRQGVL